MGVLDKLRTVGNFARKGWRSTNPDSYSHYKRGRERQRKEAERGQKEAERPAEPGGGGARPGGAGGGQEGGRRWAGRGREEARRGRECEERYAAERAAEKPQTEAPRDDMAK